MASAFAPVASAVAGYLVGTIPSADLAARLASGGSVDLRARGSGNPGAINAMDVLGKGWGAAILAADALKGVLACSAGRWLAGGTGAHVAGTAAVVGHCFPVWMGFRGGKGVAVSLGQCLATFPAYVPIDLAVAWGVGKWSGRALPGTAAASATWVAAGVLWSSRRWPNLWGPPPTAALPLASAVSSAVILYKFATAKRPQGSGPVIGPSDRAPMIGIVTDSNSQIPPELAARLGIAVVPLTVTVDGVDYQEGVDLDADDFYARFESGTPEVATSQPSPGAFAAAYQAQADAGAEAIVSVHIGSAISGTVNSARLAAAGSPVPVHIVDTGTASFSVAFAAWEAAETAAAPGATVDDVVAAAERVSGLAGNVFVVRALDLARAGGRLAADTAEGDDGGASGGGLAIPVLTLAGGVMRPLGRAADVDEAARIMADHVRAGGTSLRVGISVADVGTLPLVEALEALLRDAPEVRELIRYRVGPSVGAHTGPGVAGAMFYPSPR